MKTKSRGKKGENEIFSESSGLAAENEFTASSSENNNLAIRVSHTPRSLGYRAPIWIITKSYSRAKGKKNKTKRFSLFSYFWWAFIKFIYTMYARALRCWLSLCWCGKIWIKHSSLNIFMAQMAARRWERSIKRTELLFNFSVFPFAPRLVSIPTDGAGHKIRIKLATL